MAVDPRNFLLNTDYEIDKIVYFTSGSLLAGNTQNITHNLGFTPLVFGVCAFNSDFRDPHALPYEYLTQSNTVAFTLGADGTNVQIGYDDYNAPSSRAYYRIYAFEPSNSAAVVAPTSSNANKFILNTDYNYCKLYKKGTVSGNANTNVAHNLGYLPQVLAWSEDSSGLIMPIETSVWDSSPFGNTNGVGVTTSNVQFKFSGVGYSKIHYRIYYDEI